jgi:hypothetical protein
MYEPAGIEAAQFERHSVNGAQGAGRTRGFRICGGADSEIAMVGVATGSGQNVLDRSARLIRAWRVQR